MKCLSSPFLFLVAVLFGLRPAWAQDPQPCTPPTTEIAEGTAVSLPTAGGPFTSVTLVKVAEGTATALSENRGTFELEAADTTWTPDEVAKGLIEFEVETDSTTTLGLGWDGSGTACFQILTSYLGTQLGRGGGNKKKLEEEGDIKGYDADECNLAGSEWEGEIARTEERGYTILVVRPQSGLCYRSRPYGVEGDGIYVGIFTKEPSVWSRGRIDFDPCRLESAAPNILVSGDLSILRSGKQSGGDYRLIKQAPRYCFNESVNITVNPQKAFENETASETINLQQHKRYRATIQAGILLTDLQDRSFGLRPDGDKQRIFEKGPEGNGPRYVATLVLYAFPKYIPSLFQGRVYRGRDVVNDQDLLDRLSLTFGFGLNDPMKEFVAGFGFEVIAGINVVGAWYFAQIPELVGVSEGDEFGGQESEIPVLKRWESDFQLGFSMDLRYLAGFF